MSKYAKNMRPNRSAPSSFNSSLNLWTIPFAGTMTLLDSIPSSYPRPMPRNRSNIFVKCFNVFPAVTLCHWRVPERHDYHAPPTVTGCVTLYWRHCSCFGVFTTPASFLTQYTTSNGNIHRSQARRQTQRYSHKGTHRHTRLQSSNNPKRAFNQQNGPSGTNVNPMQRLI